MLHWNELRHFQPEEFRCPCCGAQDMDPAFMRRLDAARALAGQPFAVASGFRCPRHNRAVGGIPNSAHLLGLAADLVCSDSRSRFLMLDALLRAGFTRLGLSKEQGFLHVDMAPDLPPGVVWLY